MFKDITGQQFGKLKVVSINNEKSSKAQSTYWNCICECGNTIIVRTNNLTSGHTTSCGCNRNSACCKAKGNRNYLNLTNKKFGKLTVIEATEKRDKKSIIWKCKCDCGNECLVSSRALTHGEITSCRQGECSRVHNFTFQRFGYLTAIAPTEQRGQSGAIYWKCRCDCGAMIEVLSTNLMQGKVKSCGCKTTDMKIKAATLDNMTRGITKANTSGHVGVSYVKARDKWKAQIGLRVDGKKKTKHLGYFDNYEDAVIARETAEQEYFSNIVRLFS